MNKEGFLEAINTLKLYRRAELLDSDGDSLVEALYVDPLPDEHVLRTVLRPNTTFLVGRKGTGKSTIFQIAQKKLDGEKNTTWAYIDIKTMFEASTSLLVAELPPEAKSALPEAAYRKAVIFNYFLTALVKEIRNQIDKRIQSSLWERVKSAFTGSVSELFEELDQFIKDIEQNKYLDVTGSLSQQTAESQKQSRKESSTTDDSLEISPKAITISLKDINNLIHEVEKTKSQNYSQVYIRIFDIKGLIDRLREILGRLNLRHLYIFIDDFSELPRSDMEEIVDTVLAPFNNWSEEFIKLKIAVYPGRVFLGAIDRSKIDEIYLDIYRAYGRDDVSGMEERAIDFVKRIITRRLDHYKAGDISSYFDAEAQILWRSCFYCSLGNPRILGYILYYCYETDTVYGRKIESNTLKKAARRYYEEKIEEYFRLNKFLHEAFEERSSIYSLKELLEALVKRAKSLRTYRESKVMAELTGRPPTSHFHVKTEYDSVLSTLELNFFITKYYEMKDRDGRDVSVYALNYGLCQQQAISFGRPKEKREHRLYFVERIYDYSPIIAGYIKVNQEILCDNCGERHAHEMLPAIQAFGMLCPKCKKGQCKVVNLSRKYEQLIKSVSAENLLPEAELGILKTLHDHREQMFAKEIASELDCSYQLVGLRARNLAERELINRGKNEQGRRTFEIQGKAASIYFTILPEDIMDFAERESDDKGFEAEDY
ncbi:MAG: hypothetical protein V4773_16570 [Verrucomicrobiota bacterium]